MLILLPGLASAQLKKDAPTVLITGSSRGLGLELARQYAAHGWNVIATSRHTTGDPATTELEKIHAEHPQLVLEKLDVTDSPGIRALATRYHDQPIDVLINNAANVESTFAADMQAAAVTYDKIDFDAARRDFDVNTLGAMRVSQAFMPNVTASKLKKVITVTSLAGSFGQPLPGAIGMNYGASKAALNKYMVLLSIAMRDKGVIVALVQPVFVATKSDLANMKGAAPVDQEVGKLIKIIDGMTLGSAGKITNFSTGKIDPF
jgi:NAD(P)-dependent dehydrogenase (short-subunit alcohol dehydrogenase family)